MLFDIYVIGCGGIGGFVLETLPQVMACLQLDSLPKDIAEAVLAEEGLSGELDTAQVGFKKLVLVDGDSFAGHNALRQAGTNGSKLAVQMRKIREKDAFTTWLNKTHLLGYQTYINPSNMDQIFADDKSYCGATKIVLLCVDNHKTRYEVTRWFERHCDNGLLINGGNQKVTGNVTVYEKFWGTPLDPPIYKLYPEVTDKADKRPDEVHCDEIHLSNDQTALINQMIASIMLNMLRKYVTARGGRTAFDQKLRQRGKDGENLTQRKNEVIIDLETNTMMSLSHSKDTDNRRVPVTELENVPENAELN